MHSLIWDPDQFTGDRRHSDLMRFSSPSWYKRKNNVMQWKLSQAEFAWASVTEKGAENNKQSSDKRSNWKDLWYESRIKQWAQSPLENKNKYFTFEREEMGGGGGERRISVDVSLTWGDKKEQVVSTRNWSALTSSKRSLIGTFMLSCSYFSHPQNLALSFTNLTQGTMTHHSKRLDSSFGFFPKT